MTLPASLLLAAATAAEAATAATRAALAAPAPQPSDAAILAALNGLPDAAAKGRTVDPDARTFPALTWDATDRAAEALASVVTDRLRACEIVVNWTPAGPGRTALAVDYATLVRAAEKIAAPTWLAEADVAWRDRAGERGVVLVLTPGAPPSFGLDGRSHTPFHGWLARPVADVVAEAAAALRLPAWSLDAVRRLWAERAGEWATVERCAVRQIGGRMLPGPWLLFTAVEMPDAWLDPIAYHDAPAERLVADAATQVGPWTRPAPVDLAPAPVDVTDFEGSEETPAEAPPSDEAPPVAPVGWTLDGVGARWEAKRPGGVVTSIDGVLRFVAPDGTDVQLDESAVAKDSSAKVVQRAVFVASLKRKEPTT